MFGTGLARVLADDAVRAVNAIAASRSRDAKVLAVYVPTGLDSTTGAVLSVIAVQADLTVSFLGQKHVLHTRCGPAISGDLRFEELAVPATSSGRIVTLARRQ